MLAMFMCNVSDRQALFALSEPVQYGEPVKTTSYVIASRSGPLGYLKEILIFPANETGEILDYLEIGGSYHETSFKSVIEGMGYQVVP